MDLLRQQIEKIVPLTDEEFETVASHFTLKKLKKKQFLLQEGDKVTNDWFVLKGCLKAYFLDQNGKMHVLQFAMEDWWITDYYAYFFNSESTIYIDCIEDCELLALPLCHREDLCAKMHKIEHFFRKKSNLGYVALQRRILSLLNCDAKMRHDQLLQLYPKLFERVPKIHIASYLGLSRETLSRLI